MTRTMKYKEYGECEVEFAFYANDQHAIVLKGLPGTEYEYETIIVATVAIEEPVTDTEVAIKNYNENKGIYEALVGEGIISTVKRKVRLGYVEALICDLLVTV